jgi:hypothetical protein
VVEINTAFEWYPLISIIDHHGMRASRLNLIDYNINLKTSMILKIKRKYLVPLDILSLADCMRNFNSTIHQGESISILIGVSTTLKMNEITTGCI